MKSKVNEIKDVMYNGEFKGVINIMLHTAITN